MKVLNLRCEHDHAFEGWFGSEEDYVSQVERALLECPLCASKQVQRLPSAPRLNLGHAQSNEVRPAQNSNERGDDHPVPAMLPQPTTPQHQAVQALWVQAVRHVLASTDDVGARFAEEARRIHYGEAEQRGIRGQTSREEAEALHDEGIEFFALPIPAALKGPMQ
ncbi:MAG: DUF1178 family protein [Burkholderiales bacterium]